MTEHWYRYRDYRSGGGEDYDGSYSRAEIVCDKFRVLKHTPKGVQLEYEHHKPRFVLLDARKRFACPTEEEAMVSFLARKKRQLSILKAQAKHVEEVLRLANGETNTHALFN